MFNAISPAVVCASMILFALNAMLRVLVPLETNVPVVKLAPNAIVPAVKVYEAVAANAVALLTLTVPAVCVNVVVVGNVPPLRFTVPVVNVKIVAFKTAPVGLVSVPPLTVVGAVNVPLSVVVPLVQVNDDKVFPLPVTVPVPTIVAVKLVYVPPVANVKLFNFNVNRVFTEQVLPVKSNRSK